MRPRSQGATADGIRANMNFDDSGAPRPSGEGNFRAHADEGFAACRFHGRGGDELGLAISTTRNGRLHRKRTLATDRNGAEAALCPALDNRP